MQLQLLVRTHCLGFLLLTSNVSGGLWDLLIACSITYHSLIGGPEGYGGVLFIFEE